MSAPQKRFDWMDLVLGVGAGFALGMVLGCAKPVTYHMRYQYEVVWVSGQRDTFPGSRIGIAVFQGGSNDYVWLDTDRGAESVRRIR